MHASASPNRPPTHTHPSTIKPNTAYMLDEDDAALMEPEIPPYTETDRKHMRRALQLAAQALGRTRPNPVVGCVVLDSAGDVVGEGFHPKAGEPHAEVFALREAGDKAKGGTAYVTLEPCNHTGKTPPCVDALLAAGVAKVVAGMVDPFPLVGGKGLERLKANGVEVVVGCEEGKCKELNRPFLHRVAHGTPLGFLPLSFHDHQFLRPSHDTLMLGDGAKTMTMVDAVVVDVDAQGLKALEELEAANDLQDAVVRVVLAPSLADVPAGHSVWKGHRGVRRMVMTPKAEAEESAALQALGVEVIEMGTDPLAVGTYLHDMGLLSALWLLCAEGAKAAVKAGVVQDLWIHVTLQEADELDGVDDPDWLGKQFGRPMKVAVMSCDALGTGACLMSLTVDDEHVMA